MLDAYTGTRSRILPPSSWYTGRPVSLPSRSQSAVSMPLTARSRNAPRYLYSPRTARSTTAPTSQASCPSACRATSRCSTSAVMPGSDGAVWPNPVWPSSVLTWTMQMFPET